MADISQVVQRTLAKLSPPHRRTLTGLQRKDPDLFYRTMLVVSRHHRIIASGNKSAWKNMRKENLALVQNIPDV